MKEMIQLSFTLVRCNIHVKIVTKTTDNFLDKNI